jgi:hypothetical protein
MLCENVGGRNVLPMKELVAMIERNKLEISDPEKVGYCPDCTTN